MEKIGLEIIDPKLARDTYNHISVSSSQADPWRLFLNPDIVIRVANTVLDKWGEQKIDGIGSVSDLGMSLAVIIAFEAYKRQLFSGQLFFLNPRAKLDQWIFPPETEIWLNEKNIFLWDDIVNTGSHVLAAIERLRRNGGIVRGFATLLDNTAEPNRTAVKKIVQMDFPSYAICRPPIGI